MVITSIPVPLEGQHFEARLADWKAREVGVPAQITGVAVYSTDKALLAEIGERHLWFPLKALTIQRVWGEPTSFFPTNRERMCDHNGSRFLLRAPFDESLRQELKGIPGAIWHPDLKVWSAPTTAAKEVSDVCVDWGFTLTDAASDVMSGVERMLIKSSATASALDIPLPAGEFLYPYQKVGIEYLMDARRAILGDEPGLGKTAQALLTLETLNAYPAAIVVPATLKLNWEREIEKWTPQREARIINASDDDIGRQDITILNYDILHKHVPELQLRSLRAVIFDESHMLKNPRARRTKQAKILAQGIDVRLALTGTAVLNKPADLAPQLAILDRAKEFGGEWHFVSTYQDAPRYRLVDLNRKLRSTCYIARKKSEVLLELPAKRQVVVPLAIDNRAEYQQAQEDLIAWLRAAVLDDRKFFKSLGGVTGAERELRIRARQNEVAIKARRAEQLVKLTALRHIAARGKLTGALQWIDAFLQQDQKLVVFAWHTDIIERLAEELQCDLIVGSTSLARRQRAIDAFQNDPTVRVLVCNLQAGGVGITLTAASNVAMLELPWTPALLDQAIDRTHRIGQRDSVTGWLLLGHNTIEETMASLLDRKRTIVDAVLLGDESDERASIMGDLIDALVKEVKATV